MASSIGTNFLCDNKGSYSFNTLTVDNDLRFASDQQYLMVTADDFGYETKRDDGILESFNKGIVTRASLLVNGSSAKTTAVQLAKNNNMPLGLHLNLTEGEPLYEGDSSLKDGRFFRGKLGLRDSLARGEIDMINVKDEVIAQIKTFIQLVGHSPNHVDGHQHIHVLPGIREVIAELMQTYSLHQIRIPFETNLPDWFLLNRTFYNTVLQDAREAMEVYSKYGIRFPDKFIGISLMGNYMSVERIMEAIRKSEYVQQNYGTTFSELMVHPGYACVSGVGGCGGGPDDFACSLEREHEANVLQHPEFKKLLHEKGVKLIS